MKDVLSNFQWHSSFPLDETINKKKKITKIAKTKANLEKFSKVRTASEFLIHKSSKALWRMSSDGSFIEPVFEGDILAKEDL